MMQLHSCYLDFMQQVQNCGRGELTSYPEAEIHISL